LQPWLKNKLQMKSLPDRQPPQLNTPLPSSIATLQIPANSGTNGHCSHHSCNQLQAPARRTPSQIHYAERSHGYGLQPFSFDADVSAITAKQDRIQARFGCWRLKGTTNDIDAIRELMGCPPVNQRDLHSLDEIYGRFLFRPQKHELFRPAMSVRDRPLKLGDTILPPPVFSGRWTFSKYARTDDSEVTSNTHLDVWLNPNVFVRHQPSVPWPDLKKRGSWPVAVLFGNELPKRIKGEESCDGRENWLPNYQRLTAFTNPERWQRHLRNLVCSVPKQFETELKRLNVLHDFPFVEIERKENVRLSVVETYWEFSSDDPISDVLNLRDAFLSLVSGLRRTRFYPVVEETIERNCASLIADICPGKRLRIYAKTNRRARVEVIHTLGRDKYRLPGGRSAAKWDGLAAMIESLAEDAVETVRWAFNHFKTQAQSVPSELTAYDLALKIGSVSRDESIAKQICDSLVAFGAIAAAGNSDGISRTLQGLSKGGLLKYRPDAGQGGNYVIESRYRTALEELRERRNHLVCAA
jgi:hypothetical protein